MNHIEADEAIMKDIAKSLLHAAARGEQWAVSELNGLLHFNKKDD